MVTAQLTLNRNSRDAKSKDKIFMENYLTRKKIFNSFNFLRN